MGKESATRSYIDQKQRWAHFGWSLSLTATTAAEQQEQKHQQRDELQPLESGDGDNPISETLNNNKFEHMLFRETSHDSNHDSDRDAAAFEYPQPEALAQRPRLATLRELERDSEDEGPAAGPQHSVAAAASRYSSGRRNERNTSESPGDSLHTALTPSDFPSLSSFGVDAPPDEGPGSGPKSSSSDRAPLQNASFATPPRRTPAPVSEDLTETSGGLRSALLGARSRSSTPAPAAPVLKMTATANESDMYIIQHHHLLACLEHAVVSVHSIYSIPHNISLLQYNILVH